MQKKYDECKRNYFKLRDERERLRTDLEKAKGSVAGPAGDMMTKSSSAPQNGIGPSTSDVQASYESLKTKYRVSLSPHFLSLLLAHNCV